MDLESKLRILGGGARFDAVGPSGEGKCITPAGYGDCGICFLRAAGRGFFPVLKVLFTNRCRYDCAYCVNRVSRDGPRASFEPGELAALVDDFQRKGRIKGLFLSSAVQVSPDYTMERLLSTVERLRRVHGYEGYIHLKVLPGADPELVRRAARYADRMSVNIELPTEESLKRLAPQKTKEGILGPMRELQAATVSAEEERRFRGGKPLLPSGQTTQLIVGASPESDLEILELAHSLYERYGLRRVYYSAYVPVSDDPRLPRSVFPPRRREHRLYQADWLIRCYGFSPREILDGDSPWLEEDLDPKTAWALRHPEFFPVEVNRADYEVLLRVPGIGVRAAGRIVAARRVHSLDAGALKRLGVRLGRARFFITCMGKRLPGGGVWPWKGGGSTAGSGNSMSVPRNRGDRQLVLTPVSSAAGEGIEADSPEGEF